MGLAGKVCVGEFAVDGEGGIGLPKALLRKILAGPVVDD
jgi:hypothetical protein